MELTLDGKKQIIHNDIHNDIHYDIQKKSMNTHKYTIYIHYYKRN